MEAQQNDRLGMGHYKLCMVDRYWPRRYPYFRDPVIVQAEMENGCEQGSRSYDDFRGYLCGTISDDPRRQDMGHVFLFPLSEYTWSCLAQL